MDIFLLGRAVENSALLYSNNEIISQSESEGNVLIIIDKITKKGFLHTGTEFIEFVSVGLLPNNQCYLTRQSDRLIFSVPPLELNKNKKVIIDRTKVLGWEKFDLIPISLEHENSFSEIKTIKDLYFTNDNSDFFKKISKSTLKEKNIVLSKTLEIMSIKDFNILSQYYVEHKDELRSLAKNSKDPFFFESVKHLTNNKKQDYFASSALDFISNRDNLFSLAKNKWMHLNCYLRKQFNPKNKFCVVATAKNEGVYLLEWISYYKQLGANAIFVYSNGNDDGSDELLKALHNIGAIRYIENQVNSGCSAQNKAYTHALTINKEILDYEWSLFVDLDEYLIFNKSMFTSIHDFFDWHNKRDVHAIALNWIFSVPEIDSDWINIPITKRIKRFEKNANGHIKSAIKPHFFSSSLPHHPISIENFPFSYRTANGQLHLKSKRYNSLSISENPSSSHAAILHFFNRSLPEFIWKYSRNRGDHPNVIDNTAFTESLLPFLKEFMVALESKNIIDSSHYLPTDINIEWSMDELLKNDSVNNALQEVKKRTKDRYEIIYNLFWEFLETQRKKESYTADIELFTSKFQ